MLADGKYFDLASKESMEVQKFKEKNAQCYLFLFSKTLHYLQEKMQDVSAD